MADGHIPDEAELKQMQRRLKDTKKAEKKRKKADKKAKKTQQKTIKSAMKRERKARKMAKELGQAYVPPPPPPPPQETAQAGQIEWVRKSVKPINDVEKEVDRIFERRGVELRERWKEKYGDELEVPEDLIKPKPDIAQLDRAPTRVDASLPPPPSTESGGRFARFKPSPKPREAKPARLEEGNEFPIYILKAPTKGLWLYQKFGVGKGKAISIIVMIISLILWFPMLIMRIPITLVLLIVRKIKGRKSPSTT